MNEEDQDELLNRVSTSSSSPYGSMYTSDNTNKSRYGSPITTSTSRKNSFSTKRKSKSRRTSSASSMSYMEVEDAHRLENMNGTGWDVSLYVSAITVSVVHQGKGGHGGHDTTNNNNNTNNSNNKNPGNDSNGSINNRNKNKNKNMLEDDEEKMDRKNSFSSTNTNESSSSKKDSSSHGIEHSHRHLIEILNLELDNISVTAEKTNKKFETRVNVSSLQIDNCLRNSYVQKLKIIENVVKLCLLY